MTDFIIASKKKNKQGAVIVNAFLGFSTICDLGWLCLVINFLSNYVYFAFSSLVLVRGCF